MSGWTSPIADGTIRFIKFLGEGMNAQVYSCVVTRDGQTSAMAAKVPHDPSTTTLSHETHMLAGLTIRNCIRMEPPQQVKDQFGVNSHVILMDKVVGRSLKELLPPGKRMAPEQVAAILQQGATALADAHRAGIAHRDIKPENLMFNPIHSKLTLIDWGESTTADSKEPRGHYDYRPPEWKSPEARGDAHDVYALGMVCTELLTGYRDPAMLHRLHGKARQVARILSTAIERNPTRRSTAQGLLKLFT